MLTLPIKKKWFDMILSGEKKSAQNADRLFHGRSYNHLMKNAKTGTEVTMRPVHDLYSTAFSFEFSIQADVDKLKKHRKKINTEKDASQMKNILKVIYNLEDDVAKYKEWAEREAEKLPEP